LGFTLLEVMIGVMVIAMLTFSLYRFVQTSIQAVQTSTDMARERQSVAGLINFVQGALNDLPSKGQGLLLGSSGKSHDLAQDQMQWVCKPGAGLMTTSGDGEYFVTLAIQPVSDSHSTDWEIGLRRRTVDSPESDYKWLSLIRPAVAMEIRYYDPRLGSWLERWNDQNTRPSLIRLRVWKTPEQPACEAVLTIPSANLQAQ